MDDVILMAIRRFWDAETCEAVYQRLLTAYLGRVESVTIVVSKSTDGDSASGQVVVAAEDYRRWLATLESRLQEYAAEASGVTDKHPGEHVDFSNRYLSP